MPLLFRLVAVRVLLGALFIYTTAIIPTPVFPALELALSNLCGDMVGMAPRGARASRQNVARAQARYGLRPDHIFMISLFNTSMALIGLVWVTAEARVAKGMPASALGNLSGHSVPFVGEVASSRLRNSWESPSIRSAGYGSGVAGLVGIVYVRGCGLVGSAFGLLRRRDAVAALVEQWGSAPWRGRLDNYPHVVVRARSEDMAVFDEDDVGGLPTLVHPGIAARCARPLPRIAEVLDSDDVCCTRFLEALRRAEPSVHGGGRAVVLMPTITLTRDACIWLLSDAKEALADGNESELASMRSVLMAEDDSLAAVDASDTSAWWPYNSDVLAPVLVELVVAEAS